MAVSRAVDLEPFNWQGTCSVHANGSWVAVETGVSGVWQLAGLAVGCEVLLFSGR